MTTSARATHLVDQLDAAVAELGHWLATGERTKCRRCAQVVPASASGMPVRHQLRGQWCEADAADEAESHARWLLS